MMVYSPEGPEPPLLPPESANREYDAKLYRKIIMTYISNNKNTTHQDLKTLAKREYGMFITDYNKWWETNRLFGLTLTHNDKVLILARCLHEISNLVQFRITSILPDKYNDNQIFLYV